MKIRQIFGEDKYPWPSIHQGVFESWTKKFEDRNQGLQAITTDEIICFEMVL